MKLIEHNINNFVFKICDLLFQNIINAQSFVSIEKFTIFVFELQNLFVFNSTSTFTDENVSYKNQIKKDYQIYLKIVMNKNIAKIIKTIKNRRSDVTKQFILISTYNTYQ